MNRMKKLWAVLLLLVASGQVFADEGMWVLKELNKQNLERMKELGFTPSYEQLYSETDPCVANAVVIFGGGCSGITVSNEGLIFTNHHCGFGSIQQLSSVEHDYLKDGFVSQSKEEELPVPGLTVRYLRETVDVSDRINSQIASIKEEHLRLAAADSIGQAMADSVGNTEFQAADVVPFYNNNKYFLIVYDVFNDVRMVFAPPSSVGKFGGDTDNWMWPRHTGDFSVFRVYADANGNPAPYSDKNVPLRPKRWFKISLKGVQENDYAMMMGFPGRTNKYYTSWEVAERRDIDNTIRIHIRDLRQKVMLDEMLKDPAVRIQYASKYAGSTNAYKNAIGSNWAIKKRNFEQMKKEEQDKLIAWSNKMCEPSYPDALMAIEQIVSDRKDLRFRSWMLDEAILRGIEFTSVPTQMDMVIEALKGKDKKARQEQLRLLERAYHGFANSNYSADVDKKIAKVMLKEYRSQVDPKAQPTYFELIDKKFKGNTDRFIDYLFEKSIFGSEDNFNKFLSRPSVKALENDPMILFAKSVRAEEANLKNALKEFEDGYAMAHRSYVKGLLAMYGDRANFPDANFTLRLTYGQVKGYSPRDCDYYGHQTTLDGVMEKEDSTNWEFVVPTHLKELYAAKDFGRYKTSDGKMPVAFSTTTHSTGGNSGSPVMNADGELIGINFDRNWEGVGGDIQYLPDYQRSIIVDIRYVLFIMDKYAGAGYLLDEMEIEE